MYYRLDRDAVSGNVYIERAFTQWASFITGQPLTDGLPLPVPFRLDVDLDEDGRPMAPRLDAYFPEESLMHKSLVEVIRGAGVDNIQTFPAVLTDSRSGQRTSDYLVINVVGLVSCANLERSEAEPLADVYYFHELVIDPGRVGALLMFRLAESQMETIVHERVAEAIRHGQFTGVVLEPLSEA